MPTYAYAVEVVPAGNGWLVQQQTTRRVYGQHRLKVVAVFGARCVARALQCELVVKRRDGSIQAKDSHGRDPADRPG